MKVYAKVMVGPNLLNNPVQHDLGVEIHHNGKVYSISETNNGQLVLRLNSGVQLIIKPNAANSVELDGEK